MQTTLRDSFFAHKGHGKAKHGKVVDVVSEKFQIRIDYLFVDDKACIHKINIRNVGDVLHGIKGVQLPSPPPAVFLLAFAVFRLAHNALRVVKYGLHQSAFDDNSGEGTHQIRVGRFDGGMGAFWATFMDQPGRLAHEHVGCSGMRPKGALSAAADMIGIVPRLNPPAFAVMQICAPEGV